MRPETGGRSVGLNHAEVSFANTLKEMTLHWAETSPYWKDEARVAFQKAFVDDLLSSARGALKAMSETQRFLERIIRECG